MKFPFTRFLGFITALILVSCARPGSPTGGPKDESAPILVTAEPPNKSLSFTGRNIALTFDEYVQLKDLSGQLLISPPLKEKPETLLKGKTLYITLKEDLKDSTTYTFSFGKAITDLNEGNEALGLKYVVSTGTYLDSLTFSGVMKDAFTDAPVEKMLALLYERNDTIPSDSLPYVAFPAYYAISNEQGSFTFENLRRDTFKLFALEDKNTDYLYNFGVESIAFIEDFIFTDTVPPLSLRAFRESPKPKFYNAQYKGYGRIDFNFNQKIDSLQISQWWPEKDSLNSIDRRLVSDADGDTLTFWFEPTDVGVEYSFLVQIDTLPKDTASTFVREVKPEALKISASISGTANPDDTFALAFNQPISYVARERISIIRNDSIPVKPVWKQSETNLLRLELLFPRAFNESYKIIVPDSALVDIFGQTLDTLEFDFKTGAADDFGKWIIDLQVDSGNFVLEILTEKNEVVKQFFLQQSEIITLPFLSPAKYKLRVIEDSNGNNKWDPGIYLAGVQPEVVRYNPSPIEIRANWEIETSWDLRKKTTETPTEDKTLEDEIQPDSPNEKEAEETDLEIKE